MDCRRVQRRLVAYLDDELAPGEVTRVEEHLSHCVACQAYLADLEETQPHAPIVQLDDGGLHAVQLRILEALDAEPEPDCSAPPRATSLRDLFTGDVRMPRGLVVLYAAALLGVIGWAASGSLIAPPAPPDNVAMDETDAPVRTAREMHQPAAYTPSDGWF